jgi:uncharacterized protein involved in exopolysaccharide biosynthesis
MLDHLKIMFAVGVIMAVLIFIATRNEKRSYTSSALINTGLVSGSNLEKDANSRVDRNYTTSEMENILNVFNAYETKEEVCARLLATCFMLTKPDYLVINPKIWNIYKENLGQSLIDSLTDTTSFDHTLEMIKAYRDKDMNNKIYELLYSKDDLFGIEHVGTYTVSQSGNSDLIKIEYSTSDPGICKKTIEILIDVANAKHQAIKRSQSGSVVAYFEKEMLKAQEVLKQAEDELLHFREENKIINYYEQTRFISAKKEDLDELYQSELMKLSAADSTRKRLERQLNSKHSLAEINDIIETKRLALNELNTKIAKLEVVSLDSSNTDYSKELRDLHSKANNLKISLIEDAKDNFKLQNTTEGLPIQEILSQWLETIIIIEETKARIAIILKRKEEFNLIYAQFAPLGSRLKRIERKIDVSERAYLETLHSLNQARLHSKNQEMSSKLELVDKPFFPANPAPSKRMMLVVVGFVVGFILTFGIVVAMEFLDNTLKSPKNTEITTELTLLGAFPKFPEIKNKKEVVNYPQVKKRALDIFLQNLKLETKIGHHYERTKQVTFLSTREGEGKSFVILMAADELRKFGEKVLCVIPNKEKETIFHFCSADYPFDNHPDNKYYEIDHTFFEKQDVTDLVDLDGEDIENYNYIFIEIPGLLQSHYPIDLIGKSTLSLLVCRANRVWNEADTKVLRIFKKGVKNEPFVFLNGARVDLLEDVIGEIPKKRSWIRRLIKTWVAFGFKQKQKI